MPKAGQVYLSPKSGAYYTIESTPFGLFMRGINNYALHPVMRVKLDNFILVGNNYKPN